MYRKPLMSEMVGIFLKTPWFFGSGPVAHTYIVIHAFTFVYHKN